MYLFGLNNKIFSNNNNIMLEIIDELNQMKDNSQDNLIISKLGDIINKMNSIIDENKKNLESIRKDISSDISSLKQNLNQRLDNLNINNNANNNVIQYKNGMCVSQTANGLKEGKAIMYWNDKSRYEGN